MQIDSMPPATNDREILDPLGSIVNPHKLFSSKQTGESVEHRLLEQKLADCVELNKRILSEAPIGVLVYDSEGHCIVANETAATIVGGSREQLLQQNFHQIRSWQHSGLLELVEQAIASGNAANCELHLTTTFGKELWLSVRVSRLTIHDQPYIMLVMDDISERKFAQLQVALQQAHLEEVVQRRTDDLQATNIRLQQEATERKRAEEHIRYQASLLQNVSDAIIATDLHFRITAWNRAAEVLYGWQEEEVLGKMVSDVLRTEYINEQADQVLQEFLTEGIWRGEVIQKHKDGKSIYILASVTQVRDSSGNAIGSVAVNRDITERKEAEAKVTILSRAIEQSPVSVMITDTTGAIEYVNPKFTRLTGYPLEEVKGQNPRFLKSGETSVAEYDTLWQTILGGGEWQGELHNRSKDGSLFWESALISPIINASGKITHFMAIKEEITERKQREKEQSSLLNLAMALRAANGKKEMLPALLEQSAHIVNAPIAAFVSYDPASGQAMLEAVFREGEPLHEMALPLPAAKGLSARVLQSGESYWSEDVLTDPGLFLPGLVGDERAVGCIPLLVQGHPLGVLWVIRKEAFTSAETRLLTAVADMAANALQRASLHDEVVRHAFNLEERVASRTHELVIANEQLKELSRLKSQFVSDVNHELRTPITNFILYLKLLEHKPEKQAQYIAVLQQEANRLHKLVKDTLDLSRLDQNRVMLDLTDLSLNQLVETVVVANSAYAEAANLELIFEPDVELPLIHGDYDKLTQVITNLVANALNYTPTGRVTVRTFLDVEHRAVGCEVQDTGCGIYKNDLPHLFDRFYRGKRDQMAPVSGTGLGLSIVKTILELHGGNITVASEVGIGSTFTVTLPLSCHATQGSLDGTR